MWLDVVGGVHIERVVVNRSHERADSRPPKGVMHTTEGSWDSAMSVFRQHFNPTFMAGMDGSRLRAAQFAPIGESVFALENPPGGLQTNLDCLVQIEIVGYSRHTPWLPEPPVVEFLRALLLRLSHSDVGIPLVHAGNGTRSKTRWNSHAGWFGHGEVPEQPSGHWDPGDLRWSELFKQEEPEMLTKEFKEWCEDRLIWQKSVAPADKDWWEDAEWVHRMIALYGPHMLFREWCDWYLHHRGEPGKRPDRVPEKVSPGYWAGLSWTLSMMSDAKSTVQMELAAKVEKIAKLSDQVDSLQIEIERVGQNGAQVDALNMKIANAERLLQEALDELGEEGS